jgi:hypothetical protein
MINLIVVCVCVCSNVMYGDGMIRQTKPQYVTNVNILQLLSSKKTHLLSILKYSCIL